MTGRQDLFDESMSLGHSAAWDLQWDRAIEFYRKALAEFPDHPTALTSLALALLETGQLNEALLAYQKAAQASPADPIPVEKTAEIYERQGKIKDSIRERERAAEMHIKRKDAGKAVDNWGHIARLEPHNLNARSRLALTYERLGKRKESVHEYLSVASILQKAGKPDRAQEVLQRALAIIPGDREVNRYLRMLQQEKELPPPSKPKGATAPLRMAQVQEFLKTEETGPSLEENGDLADPEAAAQGEALTILAGLLFEEPKGEDDGQERTLGMSAITSGAATDESKGIGRPTMYRYLGQAIDLQTRGHKEQAVKEFTRAIDSGLDHPAAHYNLGLIYKELGHYDESRKHLMAAVGHPGLSLGANLALGRLARMDEDLSEAARYLLQALRIADGMTVDSGQSTQLNQFYDTIQASQSEGDDEELATIVQRTLEFLSGPQWLQRLRQARAQLDDTKATGSVVPIAEMLAVGGTERVLKALGRIDKLTEQGLYSSAIEEALLALDFAPTFLALHQRIAEIQFQSGRVEEGMQKLNIIAETHRVRGESQQASDVLRKILDYSPINIPAHTRLINLLIQMDRIEEALAQSMELAEIYQQMAEIDTARKTLANALRLVQRTTMGENWSLKILHEMGDIDLSRLDQRSALRVYEQIRSIDPGDDKARINVIDLNLRLGQEEQAGKELDSYLEYLVENGKGPEALNFLEDMAREHPGKQALHRRLAEAYKAAGRIADAIAQFDALGEIQLDAGQVDEAIRSIKNIIALNPPDIEGYKELLSNLEASR